MGKFADKYFLTDAWTVREQGFDPRYSLVAESVFSLGNEYTGLRGYFDEGYSGERLQGSYINGVYERRILPRSGYKGMLPSTEFMVNTVDWVYTRVVCNGVTLDLAKCQVSDFSRELDMRTGLLTREFTWHVDEATDLRLRFERFVSMREEQLCGQRIEAHVLRGSAHLRVLAGLDATNPHVSAGRSFLTTVYAHADGRICQLGARTENTGQRLLAAARFDPAGGTPAGTPEGVAANEFLFELSEGEKTCLTRVAAILCARNEQEQATFARRAEDVLARLERADYEELFRASAAWWRQQWALSDIRIDGDELNQQGIRFCIFQLHQTLHTAKYGAVFGAKGLTGEAYNGNTFWDSEVYCLPFYLFNNPAAAKSILRFRYNTLPEARERAAALDCRGAFYPIATISGRECCDLWQHASLQLQASTGVAYGLWNYAHLTGDTEFLYGEGAEMLAEISRMLASRGAYDQRTGRYGYYCVMGPDEFQMMVHNNAYTNFMARKTFLYTLEVLGAMDGDRRAALFEKLSLSDGELEDWRAKARAMYIPYDEKTLLFEQHDGFFHLPHIDISAIPAEQFPLYSHWAYDRIYRNDMLKQPDVLMFMMLYGSEFTDEQVAANFDYYEPRCIHESSLSPSIHSILAARLGRLETAERFFAFATRMDLDNYNRNTGEGIHTTSIAGAWMNIVYGFGGLRSDGGTLELSPRIPRGWTGYSFSLKCGGSVLRVAVTQSDVTVSREGSGAVPLTLYGEPVTVGDVPAAVPMRRT